jgi:HPt (histidine-containing phosphotransfer) domain-containing protein
MEKTNSTEGEPIINLENLNTLSGNNTETIVSIIQVFMEQAPEQLDGLDELLEKKDWENLKAQCHKTKSSFAVVGANSVKSILQIIEEDCAKNNIDEAKFKTLIDEVHRLNVEVMKSLEKVIAN